MKRLFPELCNCGASDCPKCRPETRQYPTCRSCGDRIFRDPSYPDEVQDAMRAYCQACALEVLGIAIPFVGTLQHDTGGGWRVIRESKTH